ncbi:MAG: hypothetical protein NTY77_08945 [Elusimicrobia bacterium]|nr:hypothetical protein [Elusimicrobiota bacterium]
MAAAVLSLLCWGLAAGALAGPLTPEGLLSEVRLLAPGMSSPSPMSWLEVPAVPAPPAASAPTPADPRALYDQVVRGGSAHLQGITAPQRRQLWDATYRHPVAGIDDEKKLAKYDPQGFIGFCFGRAMAVHLLARQMGLAEDGVRKLFVIGDLREGADPEWRFHVTALVRGEDGAWYAIDPIMDDPMSAAAWMAEVRKTWDKGRKARFYMTPASTVLPDVTVVPEPGHETGTRVIELSFDPAGKAGFSPVAGLGDEVSAVSAEAAPKYFKAAGAAAGSFDFEGIPINGERVSYNGYFVDLLRDIAAGVQRLMRFSAPRPAGPKARPLGLDLGKLGRR